MFESKQFYLLSVNGIIRKGWKEWKETKIYYTARKEIKDITKLIALCF